ncbi:MAG TPA: carboxypeptidase-like regulatory domain-containing protein [Candidatus Acidoferrales bacterium]|nr:carboxypeptidase-like regulatory domain-containing protein [Candidatus Acidoferrales bacterium]
MKRQIVMATAIFMFIIWIIGTAFAEASTAQQPIVPTKMIVDHTNDQIRGRGPGVGGGGGRGPGVGGGGGRGPNPHPGVHPGPIMRPGPGPRPLPHPHPHPYRPGHFVYRPYRPWNRIIYPHPIPIFGGPLIFIPIVYPIAVPIPVYTPVPDITPTALVFTISQCQCTQLTVPYDVYFDVGGQLTAADGTPIPGAVLTEQAFYNGQWYDTQRDTTTDNNGYFTDNWLWTDMWQFPYGYTGDYHFRVVFYGDGPYAPSVSNDIVITVNFATVSQEVPSASQYVPSASNEAAVISGGQHTLSNTLKTRLLIGDW